MKSDSYGKNKPSIGSRRYEYGDASRLQGYSGTSSGELGDALVQTLRTPILVAAAAELCGNSDQGQHHRMREAIEKGITCGTTYKKSEMICPQSQRDEGVVLSFGEETCFRPARCAESRWGKGHGSLIKMLRFAPKPWGRVATANRAVRRPLSAAPRSSSKSLSLVTVVIHPIEPLGNNKTGSRVLSQF